MKPCRCWSPDQQRRSGDGSGSFSIIFDTPQPDEVNVDTSYIQPNGNYHYEYTSFTIVYGRVVTIKFDVNPTTFALVDNSLTVQVTGVGLYTIIFVGVKSNYILGNPGKTLYIDLNMVYTTPLPFPLSDVSVPIMWSIAVKEINTKGINSKLKLF